MNNKTRLIPNKTIKNTTTKIITISQITEISKVATKNKLQAYNKRFLKKTKPHIPTTNNCPNNKTQNPIKNWALLYRSLKQYFVTRTYSLNRLRTNCCCRDSSRSWRTTGWRKGTAASPFWLLWRAIRVRSSRLVLRELMHVVGQDLWKGYRGI